MGRKQKYSPEFKKQCCLDYLAGKSILQICQENGLPETLESSLYEWVEYYQKFGPSFFEPKSKNENYSPEFKERVVLEHLYAGVSQTQLAVKYGIPSRSTVRSWIKSYNKGLSKGEDHIMTSSKNSKKSSKKFTTEEKISAVSWCIENGRDYQKTAERFGCSYAQIYQWCQKADKHGSAALEDRRGKRKQVADLTEKEVQERYVRQLEADKERLEREVALLKKLQDIGRKW